MVRAVPCIPDPISTPPGPSEMDDSCAIVPTQNYPLLWVLVTKKDMTNLETQDGELRELIDQIHEARPNPTKLKSLIEKYEREFGPEANKRVLEIIADSTKKAWSEIAKKIKSNDIDGILDTLWRSFERVGGEFTVERTRNSAQVHCTKCPIADTYLGIGKPEYGLIFHCSTDPHIVAGFNPAMEFKITKRLMSGDECCDHYYRLSK